MWSMGVILYIMSCGHMPFDDSNVRKMLKVQLRNQIRFPSRLDDKISNELKVQKMPFSLFVADKSPAHCDLGFSGSYKDNDTTRRN